MPTSISLLLFAIALFASSSLARADHGGVQNIPHWDEAEGVDAFRKALFRSHQACSRNAQLQVPSASDAAFCSEVFLFLKLSFLPNTDPDGYRDLTPHARAVANREGYQAYMDWVRRNIAGQMSGEESMERIQ